MTPSTQISVSGPLCGADIIKRAEESDLDLRVLYEAVIDLSADGLLTASCINLAAGILLEDLGLPNYFFNHIQKQSLTQLLQSIASNIRIIEGKAVLFGRVAHIDFDLSYGVEGQRVRIATEETRDSMESILEDLLAGHRREYYYSPENKYYTYIIRSETVPDFHPDDFKESRFLYNLAGDYSVTPEPTRIRYEKFLKKSDKATIPLVQVFNLPETGETRLMFKTDFKSPQLPILRKILADRGYTLVRAYWEPYYTKTEVSTSVCSLYIREELTRQDEDTIVRDLRNFLAFSLSPITELYLNGDLTFEEMLFGGNAIDFTHLFIFKESVNENDRDILQHLENKDHQDAFAKRIQESNKSTYGAELIYETVKKHPDLIAYLYKLFAKRFDPLEREHLTNDQVAEARNSFEKIIRSRFIDFPIGYDIFRFMFKLVSCTLKCNFFNHSKRSFSFRFDNRILDPLVFSQFVYGIFLVNGHYSCGTHMRAADIARGGLRLLRISQSNYDRELDSAVLLNYALGPKAQRIKHKDICESGSKGVVVPHPTYSRYSSDALFDYTEGILDLILKEEDTVDYYGKPEMIFFGPDEGTAQLMDAVAFRAKERGYSYWRTLTTGKSFGIPHDTYGILESGECFGLYDRADQGVELQIDGEVKLVTNNMGEIYSEIGEKIVTSGMTTSAVMSAFRTMINHYNDNEQSLNLMITGGPDGDLGANEIQCYQGPICIVIDGGSILFDPEGLDREELIKIAFNRSSSPRVNSLGYPKDKLSAQGFIVPIDAKEISLPDGTVIEDGALFHRNFLTSDLVRPYIQQANITAFIPCGGFKDTINQSNVQQFTENFAELKYIVEGANVFFDDSARRYIANNSGIKQIKDSTANKGGVFSSSIAEVLTAFLLGDEYEKQLLDDKTTRWGLVHDVLNLVIKLAEQETETLLQLYNSAPDTPLFVLSESSSESIFSFQERLTEEIDAILLDQELINSILRLYVPRILVEHLGLEQISALLTTEQLRPYRNSIITKKLASTAYYLFGSQWQEFLDLFEQNPIQTIQSILLDPERN